MDKKLQELFALVDEKYFAKDKATQSNIKDNVIAKISGDIFSEKDKLFFLQKFHQAKQRTSTAIYRILCAIIGKYLADQKNKYAIIFLDKAAPEDIEAQQQRIEWYLDIMKLTVDQQSFADTSKLWSYLWSDNKREFTKAHVRLRLLELEFFNSEWYLDWHLPGALKKLLNDEFPRLSEEDFYGVVVNFIDKYAEEYNKKSEAANEDTFKKHYSCQADMAKSIVKKFLDLSQKKSMVEQSSFSAELKSSKPLQESGTATASTSVPGWFMGGDTPTTTSDNVPGGATPGLSADADSSKSSSSSVSPISNNSPSLTKSSSTLFAMSPPASPSKIVPPAANMFSSARSSALSVLSTSDEDSSASHSTSSTPVPIPKSKKVLNALANSLASAFSPPKNGSSTTISATSSAATVSRFETENAGADVLALYEQCFGSFTK